MEESGSQGILLIEDSTEDYVVARYILRQVTDHPIRRCIDGESALDYLLHRGTHAEAQDAASPALTLVDLNLPATDGCESYIVKPVDFERLRHALVLRQIKQNARLQTIPVVVFTTSAQPYDIDLCYQLSANELLTRYWFNAVTLPERRSP